MRRDDITVIIPAYNCSGFIGKAVDSVLSQDIEGLGLIVVDDASTDDTPEFLRRYAFNPAVTVIRNPVNRKLGASRNVGLDLANGEYIFFLDADDWLSEGSLAHMREVAKTTGADVVASGVLRVDGKGNSSLYYSHDYECADREEALELFSTYKLTAPAWAKLYLRGFIERHSLRFVEPYWHEDIPWTARIAKNCGKYVSINNCYYNYYANSASVTQSEQTPLHLESYFYIYSEIAKFARELSKENIGDEALYRRLIRNYGTLEFMPKFERFAQASVLEEFRDGIFEAARNVLGADGYQLADIVCRLFEDQTRQD